MGDGPVTDPDHLPHPTLIPPSNGVDVELLPPTPAAHFQYVCLVAA